MFSNEELIILNRKIIPGETKTIELNIAKLHTMTELKIPIIVSRSIYEGPTVLLTAGIHGDELSGVEIIRQVIKNEIHHPKAGTIICVPIINVFGFVNQSREFPDGRDLNRVFPGSASGSLASRFAYYLMREVVPHVDYVLDYHAGGRSRFNAAQIRIEEKKNSLDTLAEAFNPPFLLYSSNIEGSFRKSCDDLGIKYLLFEGGKSLDISLDIVNEGVEGCKRFLNHLGMLNEKFNLLPGIRKTIKIKQSSWIRANYSGLLHSRTKYGSYVETGELLAIISDPYGAIEEEVLAPNSGFIINENQSPIVFEGDAIYHISTELLD